MFQLLYKVNHTSHKEQVMNSTRTLAEIEAQAASLKRLATAANQAGMYDALATIERKLEALRDEWRSVNDNAAEAALATEDEAAPVAKPVPVPAKLEMGMYRKQNGQIFRVYPARNGGHLLAKELLAAGEVDARKPYYFEYRGAAGRFVTPADRMTLEEAKAFGAQFGVCCVCAALLTDPESVAAGIGPVCGGRV